MVYSNKFVAVVVCGNHIVREIRETGNDVVRLPFGSDYSLRFKNQHSIRAVINVEIDGKDVLDGNQLVIEPNTTLNLLGFIKNGQVYQAFRFIKKTQKIAQHRGDFIDDGYIRVSWRYEKQQIPYPWPRWYAEPFLVGNKSFDDKYYPSNNISQWNAGPNLKKGDYSDCRVNSIPTCATQSMCHSPLHTPQDWQVHTPQDWQVNDLDQSDEGITVPGQDVHQNFYNVHVRQLEPYESSIIIHLLGQDKKTGKKFTRPKLTKTKITCPTCGKRSRSNVKYCSGCGTNLMAVV